MFHDERKRRQHEPIGGRQLFDGAWPDDFHLKVHQGLCKLCRRYFSGIFLRTSTDTT
jgi:hypothetical protein